MTSLDFSLLTLIAVLKMSLLEGKHPLINFSCLRFSASLVSLESSEFRTDPEVQSILTSGAQGTWQLAESDSSGSYDRWWGALLAAALVAAGTLPAD